MGNETIGGRLQALREAQHPVKQRMVLSELLGLNPKAFKRYERNEVIPSTKSLMVIADYFDVSIDYLLLRTDKRK